MKPQQTPPEQFQKPKAPACACLVAGAEVTVTVLTINHSAPEFVKARWGQVFQRTGQGFYLPV